MYILYTFYLCATLSLWHMWCTRQWKCAFILAFKWKYDCSRQRRLKCDGNRLLKTHQTDHTWIMMIVWWITGNKSQLFVNDCLYCVFAIFFPTGTGFLLIGLVFQCIHILFLLYLCFGCFEHGICSNADDCLERLVYEVTCYVSKFRWYEGLSKSFATWL